MSRAWERANGLQQMWGQLNQRLLRGCCGVVAVALALLVSVVLLQVICRYGFGSALSWPEEVAKLLMVWLAFLGAPVAYVRSEHARVTVLSSRLSTRDQLLAAALLDAATFGLSLVLALYAIPVVQVGWAVRATTVPVPMGWVYVAFPVGMGLVASVALESALKHLRDFRESSIQRRPEGAWARLEEHVTGRREGEVSDEAARAS